MSITVIENDDIIEVEIDNDHFSNIPASTIPISGLYTTGEFPIYNATTEKFEPSTYTEAQIIASFHSHSNKATLDLITAAFTTELKSTYDGYASLITGKVDKVTGYSLTKNDLTDILKGYYDSAYSHISLTNNPHSVTAAQVGAYTSGAVDILLGNYILSSTKGAANGVVPLNALSLIDSQYLPGYVDDIIEVADYASLPVTGSTGVIYITLDTNYTYRWSGTAYVNVSNPHSHSNKSILDGTQESFTTALKSTYDGYASLISGKIGLTALSSTITAITYTNTTGVFSLTSGYVIPTTTQETNWHTAYSHVSLTNNPHSVTATHVGLGNVTNESKATMFTSPTFTGTVTLPASTSFTTPILGVATATSLALGGATIGSNSLAVTGTTLISGNTVIGYGTPLSKLHANNATKTGADLVVLTLSMSDQTGTLSPNDGVALDFSKIYSTTNYQLARIVTSNTTNDSYDNGRMSFYTRQSGTLTEVMRLTNTGALLVGYTSDPTSGNKFAVNGASYFNGGVTAGNIVISNSASDLAKFEMTTSGEALDQKLWSWQTGTGTGINGIRLRAGNDAGTDGKNAIIIRRSGINISDITFGQTAGTGLHAIYAGNATFAGAILASAGSASAPSIATSGGATTGLYWVGGSINITSNGAQAIAFNYDTSSQIKLISSGMVSWGPDGTASGTADLRLYRDAANTLALRNSTNAQAFNIYNTYTNASNYERGYILWDTNILTIGVGKLGTGTLRSTKIAGATIQFSEAGVGNRWEMIAGGHFAPTATNNVDLGTSSYKIRTGYFGTDIYCDGNLIQSQTSKHIFGTETTDGSYKMYINGSGELVTEKRISGTWTLLHTIS